MGRIPKAIASICPNEDEEYDEPGERWLERMRSVQCERRRSEDRSKRKRRAEYVDGEVRMMVHCSVLSMGVVLRLSVTERCSDVRVVAREHDCDVVGFQSKT